MCGFLHTFAGCDDWRFGTQYECTFALCQDSRCAIKRVHYMLDGKTDVAGLIKRVHYLLDGKTNDVGVLAYSHPMSRLRVWGCVPSVNTD